MQELAIDIKVEKTENSNLAQVDFNNIPFGKIYSDHIFLADYENGEWKDFRVVPYGDFTMSPATSALHYGQSIFEGLKAFRNEKNSEEVLVFRPKDNAERLNESAKRLCMPELPVEIFMQGLHKLLEVDKGWVPNTKGSSLYIRPFMFARDAYLGMRPSDTYTFAIMTCPVGVYYSQPVKVKVEKHYSRTCNGGTGYAKVAGNYAASLLPAKLAQEEGYDQLLWTDAKEHKYIEESGTMNVMFQIDGKVITAPTLPEEDTILRSITRLSVLELLNDWGVTVEERKVLVEEVLNAAKDGSLECAFGVGTAVTIAPIAAIGNDGVNHDLPLAGDDSLSAKIKTQLQGIQTGAIDDTKGWVYKI